MPARVYKEKGISRGRPGKTSAPQFCTSARFFGICRILNIVQLWCAILPIHLSDMHPTFYYIPTFTWHWGIFPGCCELLRRQLHTTLHNHSERKQPPCHLSSFKSLASCLERHIGYDGLHGVARQSYTRQSSRQSVSIYTGQFGGHYLPRTECMLSSEQEKNYTLRLHDSSHFLVRSITGDHRE